MTQENEKLISGEETQPEEPMTSSGNSRAINTPPYMDLFAPDDSIPYKDIVKNIMNKWNIKLSRSKKQNNTV